jgi:hypothetical protein
MRKHARWFCPSMEGEGREQKQKSNILKREPNV